VQTAAHERADTGIEAARTAAEAAAERYPAHALRPDAVGIDRPGGLSAELRAQVELGELTARLHQAWTDQAATAAELGRAQQQLAAAQQYQDRHTEAAERAAEATERLAVARAEADALTPHAATAQAAITERGQQLREQIQTTWERELAQAREAARTWDEGPGRFGLNQRRVDRAEDTLQHWAGQWRHLHPHLNTDDTTALARQASMTANHDHRIQATFQNAIAEQARTELPAAHDTLAATRTAQEAATAAALEHQQAAEALRRVEWTRGGALHGLDRDPERALAQAQHTHDLAHSADQATRGVAAELHGQARARVDLPEPQQWLHEQRAEWTQATTLAQAAAQAVARAARAAERALDHDHYRHHERGIDRGGPELGM
jgi:hypothetical protein